MYQIQGPMRGSLRSKLIGQGCWLGLLGSTKALLVCRSIYGPINHHADHFGKWALMRSTPRARHVVSTPANHSVNSFLGSISSNWVTACKLMVYGRVASLGGKDAMRMAACNGWGGDSLRLAHLL